MSRPNTGMVAVSQASPSQPAARSAIEARYGPRNTVTTVVANAELAQS
jgi:hypothetical protein